MRRIIVASIVVSTALVVLLLTQKNEPDGFAFSAGPINAVNIERNGARLAVYNAGAQVGQKLDHVLLTHHRRDVIPRGLTTADKVVAPAAERALLEEPATHWDSFKKTRFHDYAQQSTKILGEAVPVERWVKEGDIIEWQGLKFNVIDTPGYTRGAVSYLVELNGKRVAFTGDLICGDGQILDLFSFQDEIPEAEIRGYHGYASRLAKLIPSLRKIAEHKPDLLVPSRGSIIRNPQQAIDKLIQRVQAMYQNYLSTNALNWYFKEKRMRICGERVLGKGADVQLMDYSRHEDTPPWIWTHSTSRLLIAENGHAFLLDCGYQRVIDAVKQLMAMGRVRKIDGIFATHCHDDHTDYVQAAAEEFACPVFALEEYEDVLERPGAYRLPALTANPIKGVNGMKSGDKMPWQEFDLTFHYYPGQMLHHGGLLVEKKGEKRVFFVGDSFSPSGMDDYCLQNRNLVHDDTGYLYCLNKLRAFRGDYWLINEHITHVFTFSDKELDYLESRYRDRIAVLRQLFPWDDPNYGIDEQWAVFYPYGSESGPNKELDLEVRISNHSPVERTFKVTPRLPAGMRLTKNDAEVTLGARQAGRVRMTVQTPQQAGVYLITADVDSKEMAFRDWVEAMIVVK